MVESPRSDVSLSDGNFSYVNLPSLVVVVRLTRVNLLSSLRVLCRRLVSWVTAVRVRG